MKYIATYGRCKLLGKVKYLTRDDAKQTKKQHLSAGLSDCQNLQVYKCECGYFHLGTKTINGEKVPRSDHRYVAEIKKKHG